MEIYSRLVAALIIGITFGVITYALPVQQRAAVRGKTEALRKKRPMQPGQKQAQAMLTTSPEYAARLDQIRKNSAQAAAKLRSALQQAQQAIQAKRQAGKPEDAAALQNDVKQTLSTISARIKKLKRQKKIVRRHAAINQ